MFNNGTIGKLIADAKRVGIAGSAHHVSCPVDLFLAGHEKPSHGFDLLRMDALLPAGAQSDGAHNICRKTRLRIG